VKIGDSLKSTDAMPEFVN